MLYVSSFLRIAEARMITLGFTAFAVTACGSPSSANDSADTAAPATGAAAHAALAQAGPAAASHTTLPIEQGIYADVESGGCASAPYIFFYDGKNIGNISQTMGAEVHQIRRVGAGGKDADADFTGFTRVWKADDMGGEVQGAKATGPGRFVWREGSPSARQMEVFDTTYQKCAFAQLSTQMQAVVRQHRPQLISAAVPQAASEAQAPGTVALVPIEKGYWAMDMSCAQAIREADPDGLPDDLPFTYLEDRIDYLGQLAVNRYESLGGNRYRLHGQASYGNGEPIQVPSRTDIIVNSRTAFTATSNDRMGSSTARYTHCPTSQIPGAVREIFEG